MSASICRSRSSAIADRCALLELALAEDRRAGRAQGPPAQLHAVRDEPPCNKVTATVRPGELSLLPPHAKSAVPMLTKVQHCQTSWLSLQSVGNGSSE